ncbi:MAG TPA: hypothetical protein VGJ42_02380 [Nitrososphaera sp.]|jgi:hypothetical protein
MKNKQQQRAELEVETAKKEENEAELTVPENEIPCPRCSDMMTLCSGFDHLYYSCDECGFVLSDFKNDR